MLLRFACSMHTHTHTHTQFSTSLSPGVTGEPLNALVSEDKVLFGLLASHPLVKTVHELEKVYSPVDVLTIAREVCVYISQFADTIIIYILALFVQ